MGFREQTENPFLLSLTKEQYPNNPFSLQQQGIQVNDVDDLIHRGGKSINAAKVPAITTFGLNATERRYSGILKRDNDLRVINCSQLGGIVSLKGIEIIDSKIIEYSGRYPGNVISTTGNILAQGSTIAGITEALQGNITLTNCKVLKKVEAGKSLFLKGVTIEESISHDNLDMKDTQVIHDVQAQNSVKIQNSHIGGKVISNGTLELNNVTLGEGFSEGNLDANELIVHRILHTNGNLNLYGGNIQGSISSGGSVNIDASEHIDSIVGEDDITVRDTDICGSITTFKGSISCFDSEARGNISAKMGAVIVSGTDVEKGIQAGSFVELDYSAVEENIYAGGKVILRNISFAKKDIFVDGDHSEVIIEAESAVYGKICFPKGNGTVIVENLDQVCPDLIEGGQVLIKTSV